MIRVSRIKPCELHTFLLIFLTSSFTIVNDVFSSMATIGIWLLLLFSLLIRTTRKGVALNLNKNPFGVMVSLTILFLLSGIINNQPGLIIIKNLFSLVTLWLFIIYYRFEDVLKAFYKVVYFIAVISIPMYLLSVLGPSFLNSFTAIGTNGRIYYNYILFDHIVGYNRNCGLFWEPGAFSSFLCLAILIWVTQVDNSIDVGYRRILVLLLALITTFSTTGYLCFALILILYLFLKKRNKTEKIIVFTLILAAVIFVLPTYYTSVFGINSQTFGKIYNFLQYRDDYIAGTFTSSVSVRLFSITKAFEVFLNNPILGVGHNNLVELTQKFTLGSITCTFINWFAINGFLYGLLMILGYVKLSRQINARAIVKILVLIILLINICTEDFSQNAVFTGLALWGYKAAKRSLDKGEVLRDEQIALG